MPSFGPREVDALQELASIGCGQALTALGKLAGRRFDMDVPEVWVGAETGAIASFLGALGRDLVAVGVKLEGRLTGDLLLALPEEDAETLAAMLGCAPGPGAELDQHVGEEGTPANEQNQHEPVHQNDDLVDGGPVDRNIGRQPPTVLVNLVHRRVLPSPQRATSLSTAASLWVR